MALAVRHNRKAADARSRTLRRRFYQGAAIATLVYVALSLIKFHGEFQYLSYELTIIWATFLLCYTSFREVLRWNDSDPQSYRGEFWAALVVGGAFWMIVWNIARAWILRLPTLPFPEDYGAATIETIVLYTISAISAFLYKNRGAIRQHALRRKVRGRIVTAKSKSPIAIVGQPTDTELTQGAEIKAVLTKAPKLDTESKPEGEHPSES